MNTPLSKIKLWGILASLTLLIVVVIVLDTLPVAPVGLFVLYVTVYVFAVHCAYKVTLFVASSALSYKELTFATVKFWVDSDAETKTPVPSALVFQPVNV